MSWLFGDSETKVSVVGVKRAGKTNFLLSLAYLVSEKGWGTVSGAGSSRYLNQFIPKLLDEDAEIPATTGNTDIEIEVNEIDTGDVSRECEFTIDTQDFSGGDFESAMNDLTERSFSNAIAADSSNSTLPEFYDLYRDSEGVIIIVDVVREISSHDAFAKNQDKNVSENLRSQLVPIVNALELTLEDTPKLDTPEIENSPIFIVFTKSDIHQMSADELFNRFKPLSSITLQRLRKRKNCTFHTYTTSAIGRGTDAKNPTAALESDGFTDLLLDMTTEFD